MFEKYEKRGLSGLINLGNTCFINSCFQILSHTYELNEILDKKSIKNINNINDSILLFEWNNLREILWKENCTVSPERFIQTIHTLAKQKNSDLFSKYSQNDITEFFVFVLNCFHNSLSREVKMTIYGEPDKEIDNIAKKCYTMINDIYSKEYSEIWEIFYGIQVSFLINTKNNKINNYTPESYSTIDLPLPLNIENPTILDCFDLFVKGEILEGENAWFNEKTKKKENAKKCIKFWSFPNILIINLKRYYANNKKNNTLITFPLKNLDLSKYVIGYNKDSYVYDLYGVCNHFGNNNGGHYTSIIKNVNKWYWFNDLFVEEIINLEKEIISQNAYCIFYRKIQIEKKTK
jgi:ubiquitin carboxyl-terminal hydrolase 8